MDGRLATAIGCAHFFSSGHSLSASALTAWEPGTKGAYNSINIGYILGEILRRVSGKTVGKFLREENGAAVFAVGTRLLAAHPPVRFYFPPDARAPAFLRDQLNLSPAAR